MRILKNVLKLLFLILGLIIVYFIGLNLYYEFVPSRAKIEDVEFCECLKEYKTNIKCSKYGNVSKQSAMDYLMEQSNLSVIFVENPSMTARKKLEEMKLQWYLCQERVKDCFLCENKQQDK